ncbi:MAG: TetR/AcrR family transcriptional regulator [Candidatus Methylomirabilis sp.]|nr:TetR/AcrR family transcriptional regulator [Deltaproteobacteria bacterium]
MGFGSERPRAEEDSAEIILDAAEALFAERGFAGAKTQEIADRSGYDKKLLFYRFGSKEGLYKAVIKRALLRMGAFNFQWGNDPGTLVGNFELALGALTDFAAAHRSAVRIIVREAMDSGDAIRDVLGEVIPQVFGAAERNFREAQARGEVAEFDPRHFLITVGGASLFYFLVVDFLRDLWGVDPLAPAELKRRKEALARAILDGLRPR